MSVITTTTEQAQICESNGIPLQRDGESLTCKPSDVISVLQPLFADTDIEFDESAAQAARLLFAQSIESVVKEAISEFGGEPPVDRPPSRRSRRAQI